MTRATCQFTLHHSAPHPFVGLVYTDATITYSVVDVFAPHVLVQIPTETKPATINPSRSSAGQSSIVAGSIVAGSTLPGSIVTAADIRHKLSTCRLCQSGSESWHAHIYVVPWFRAGLRYPCGQLVDFECGHRQAVVVAFEACRQTANALGVDSQLVQLRVLAHEIGHLFNLGHEPSGSIMTPIDHLVSALPADALSNALPGTLNDCQRAWLENAPECDVRPGRSRFHGKGGLHAFGRPQQNVLKEQA